MSERPLPQTPYKGLVPYSEEDAPFFFGREAEREIITANLLASRLTVLYGASGVGKSSVLRAGVAHHLRQLARQNLEERGAAELVVVVFSSWRDDPMAGLTERVRQSVIPLLPEGVAPPTPSTGSLVEILQTWAERVGGDLLVILDQFEEYFLYHGQEEGAGTFAIEFPRAVNRPDLRASFLVSIREDALAKLDRFKGRIPNLFDNYLRIRHLDRRAGRAAIEKPIDRFNRLSGGDPVSVEPALVEAVLNQVQTGRVTLAESGQGGIRASSDVGGAGTQIETPYLQLVMTRLWEEEMKAGFRVLRFETLDRLGGAERIVRTHLDKVMDALPIQDQDAAARIFHHLVTPGGSKIAHTAADLAAYTGLPEPQLDPVLHTLSGGDVRVLRPADSRYEIFHDVLAPAVLDWRRRYLERQRQEEIRRQEQERRAHEQEQIRREEREQQEQKRRRLQRALMVTMLVGIIALAGLAGLAWLQRQQAVEASAEAYMALARADSARKAAEEARADAENSRSRLAQERTAYEELARNVRSSNPALFRQAIAVLDSDARQAIALDTAISTAAQVVPLVYIQFQGTVSRSMLEELRAELNQSGFPAPGTERIQSNFSSHLSYFHEEDSGLATTLARITEEFFEKRGCSLDLPLRHLPQARSRVRRGQVEIWVHLNCPR